MKAILQSVSSNSLFSSDGAGADHRDDSIRILTAFAFSGAVEALEPRPTPLPTCAPWGELCGQ
jgi:hypothetical protein